MVVVVNVGRNRCSYLACIWVFSLHPTEVLIRFCVQACLIKALDTTFHPVQHRLDIVELLPASGVLDSIKNDIFVKEVLVKGSPGWNEHLMV